MRNALAHGSTRSVKQIRREFTDSLSLPPEQQRPAGYLRGQHAAGQTRFEHLLAECIAVRTLYREASSVGATTRGCKLAP